MIKKIVAFGNSHALLIPKAVVDILGWQIGTEVEVTTDGNSLNIKPVVKRSLFSALKASGNGAKIGSS